MNEPSSAASGNTHTQRSLLRLAMACCIALLSLLVIAGSRGRIARLLVEFDVSFSPMTAFALSVVLPAALVLLVIVTVGVEISVKGAATRNMWNAIAIGLALTCLTTYTIGVGLPLVQLIENLS